MMKTLFSHKQALMIAQHSIDRRDAELLLCSVLKTRREFLITECHILLPSQYKKFIQLVEKRASGIPYAYLMGNKEFYGLDLIVNTSTLIPRPETEELIDLFQFENPLRKTFSKKIVDIGTGSGAIAVTLSHLGWRCIHASDISKRAIKVAEKNAQKYHADIDFKIGSLLTPWESTSIDIIICNLPYVPTQDESSLSSEVLHEPHTALFSGIDGTQHYKKLTEQIQQRTDIESFYWEIDHSHAENLMQFCTEMLLDFEISLKQDLSKKNRFLTGKRKNS